MLSENKKKMLELGLALISIISNIFFLLPYEPFPQFWGKLHLYYWGWIPSIILPSLTIVLILIWKSGTKILRGITLIISLIALVMGTILFALLFFIGHITF